MLQATLALSLMAACSKLATPFLSVFAIVFYRSLLGTIFLIPFVCKNPNKLKGFSKHDQRVILLRCLSGFLALCCFYYTLAKVELGAAVVLNYTSPIFIALLSAVLLNEKIHWWQGLLTLLSFFGVYIVMEPYLYFQPLSVFIGLLSGFLTAVSYVAIRFLSGSVHHQSIVLFFSSFSTLAAIPFAFVYDFSLNLYVLAPLLGVGFLAYIGQVKLTSAFTKAPASLVSNFGYLNVIFAALWGFLFWNESLSWRLITGASLIILSGAVLRSFYRQH